MAGQDVSCMLIGSCSFLLYDEESKSFLFFSDKIAARGCDVHVDSMYGPENCHFSFFRSRPFTLYFAYNGQSGLMEGVINFFLQKSKALKDLLSQVMTAHHHILCAAGRVAPSHFQQSALE